MGDRNDKHIDFVFTYVKKLTEDFKELRSGVSSLDKSIFDVSDNGWVFINFVNF